MSGETTQHIGDAVHMNNLVSYDSGSNQLSAYKSELGQMNQLGTCIAPWHWDNYYHYYHYHYPSVVYEKSKMEIAFKIVARLLEKKLVKAMSVKQFIELTNEVAEIV